MANCLDKSADPNAPQSNPRVRMEFVDISGETGACL